MFMADYIPNLCNIEKNSQFKINPHKNNKIFFLKKKPKNIW